jgi:hypothetical protein
MANWFDNSYNAAAGVSGAASGSDIGSQIGGAINTAEKAYENYNATQIAQQKNELAYRNPGLNLQNVGAPGGSFFQNNRNLILIGGLLVGGFFLYKFAKKNKYV